MLSALAAGLIAGCTTERAPGGHGPVRASLATDQCASNMHDLCGYLLQYYVVHQSLPEKLTDLRPLVDVDRQLPLTCPVSGKPYLYFRDGLIAASEPKQLLVVDPEPTHDGERWGIVTLPPEGKTPLGLWVVRLSPLAFRQFHTP